MCLSKSRPASCSPRRAVILRTVHLVTMPLGNIAADTTHPPAIGGSQCLPRVLSLELTCAATAEQQGFRVVTRIGLCSWSLDGVGRAESLFWRQATEPPQSKRAGTADALSQPACSASLPPSLAVPASADAAAPVLAAPLRHRTLVEQHSEQATQRSGDYASPENLSPTRNSWCDASRH